MKNIDEGAYWVVALGLLLTFLTLTCLSAMRTEKEVKISAFEHGYVQQTVPGYTSPVWVAKRDSL